MLLTDLERGKKMNKNKKEPSISREGSKKHCPNCPPLKHNDRSEYCFNCGQKLEVHSEI